MKLATYNIEDGGAGREDFIEATVAALDADVVVLQEVMSETLPRRIARSLGYSGTLADRGLRSRRVCILSRLPIVARSCVLLRDSGETAVLLTVRVGDTDVGVAGVHLHPMLLPHAESIRCKQIDRLVPECRRRLPTQHVIAGDFNLVAHGDEPAFGNAPLWVRAQTIGGHLREARAYRRLVEHGYADAFRTCQRVAAGFTLPAKDPHVRLDYVFIANDLAFAIDSCVVADAAPSVRQASDHLPVLVGLFGNREGAFAAEETG